LRAFRIRPEAEALASANKRIANILRQAGEVQTVEVGADKQPPEESALAQALQGLDSPLNTAVNHRDFGAALHMLAGLRDPVDRFFDAVLVMDPDPGVRARRLRLLARLREAFLQVADIGELEGTGEK
jgi:glycyl-tRNA synthetase beta chain